MECLARPARHQKSYKRHDYGNHDAIVTNVNRISYQEDKAIKGYSITNNNELKYHDHNNPNNTHMQVIHTLYRFYICI